jgi:hypothetical protein
MKIYLRNCGYTKLSRTVSHDFSFVGKVSSEDGKVCFFEKFVYVSLYSALRVPGSSVSTLSNYGLVDRGSRFDPGRGKEFFL